MQTFVWLKLDRFTASNKPGAQDILFASTCCQLLVRRRGHIVYYLVKLRQWININNFSRLSSITTDAR